MPRRPDPSPHDRRGVLGGARGDDDDAEVTSARAPAGGGGGPSHTVRRMSVGATFALAIVGGYLGLQGCGRPPEQASEPFCAQIQVVRDVGVHLGAYDAASLRGDLVALDELARVAPPDVAPDVAAVAGVVRSLTEAVGPNADVETEDRVRAVFVQRRAELERLATSARRVADAAKASCGVDLNPPTPTAVPTTTPGSTPGTGVPRAPAAPR